MRIARLEILLRPKLAYRKAIELSPADSNGYFQLIFFLTLNDRVGEVKPLLVAYDQHKDTDEDVFESVIRQLYFAAEREAATKLAASEPARVKGSYAANLIPRKNSPGCRTLRRRT